MIDDPKITRIRHFLVRLNIVAGILIGVAIALLVPRLFNYEWPTIILIGTTALLFLFGSLFGILLWRYTIGFILAFGVGIWWGHKTRND